MKVYVAFGDAYADRHIVGIYSTRLLAVEASRKANEGPYALLCIKGTSDVEVWEVEL